MHTYIITCFCDNILLFDKLISFIYYIYVITLNILLFYLQKKILKKKNLLINKDLFDILLIGVNDCYEYKILK